MLDIKYCFTCGDLDLSKIIKKCQNIMTRIVVADKKNTIMLVKLLVKNYSPFDWGQIGIKLGTKHII